MIGTPLTIKNHETGAEIVLNDHVTDPNNVIALQTFPTLAPEVRPNNLPKNGAHGEFRLPHYYSGMSVVLQGVIVGESEANVWQIKQQFDNILKLSRTGFPEPYTGSDTPKPMRDTLVRISYLDPLGNQIFVDGTPLNSVSYDRKLQEQCVLNFQVIVRVNFPYLLIKDAVPTIETGLLGSIKSGFQLGNSKVDRLGTEYATNELTITVPTPAFGVIKVFGSDDGVIVNPRVTNKTNGTSVRIRRPLSGSVNFFEINGLEQKIENQSGVNLTAYSEGGFIYLDAGENVLLYTAETVLPY